MCCKLCVEYFVDLLIYWSMLFILHMLFGLFCFFIGLFWVVFLIWISCLDSFDCYLVIKFGNTCNGKHLWRSPHLVIIVLTLLLKISGESIVWFTDEGLLLKRLNNPDVLFCIIHFFLYIIYKGRQASADLLLFSLKALIFLWI